MFSLLYGFWEYLTRKEELRILILGLDKSGKTTLLEKTKTLISDLPGLSADKILPTVGLNVGRMDAWKSSLMFWDLGGQTGLRSIWDKYYADSHAVIYVVDSSDPHRMEDCKAALERILGSMDLHGAPLLVAANKQDLQNAMSPEEVREHLGLGKLDSRATKIQGISAVEGNGINEGLRWLVTEILRSDRCSRLRQKAVRLR